METRSYNVLELHAYNIVLAEITLLLKPFKLLLYR